MHSVMCSWQDRSTVHVHGSTVFMRDHGYKKAKNFIIAEVLPTLTLRWQESYYSVIEADGSVEVCAKLSTLQFEGIVQFDYTTFGGSAEGM